MREQDDRVLHLVKHECMTVVNVGEKLFLGFQEPEGFIEVEAHDSEEGVDVRYCHGLHVAELRTRGELVVDGGNVVCSSSRPWAAVESSLKQGHVLRTRTRSLYAIEAPVTGCRRKISVQTAVPLSGESTLICVNTLWRVAKPLVLSLRNFQNQCWSIVCETLL
jgi:hypothetical protein